MKTPDEIKKGLERCMMGDPLACDSYYCSYRGQACEKDELLADALEYIQQLENHIGEFTEKVSQLEAAQPKWISVEDRMPDPFVSVLTYMPDMPTFPPVREAYRVGNVFYIPAMADREHVTHWMPMPEPPKEG